MFRCRYTEELPTGEISDPIALLRLANEYNMIDLVTHLEGIRKSIEESCAFLIFLLSASLHGKVTY